MNSTRLSWLLPALVSAAGLVVLVAIFPYNAGYGFERMPMLKSLREFWSGEDWEHCVLVPFIAGFLVWWKRKEFAAVPIQPATIGGLGVLALAMAFYIAGYKTDINYLGFAGIQLFVAGLILWFLGWRWMVALAFIWMFLAFMWPLIFLQDTLAFRLRVIMSAASTDVLNFIGLHAMQRGTAVLSAPDLLMGLPAGARFSVDVADPCSGIRSLFALMMVSALYGYLTLNSWWKHSLFFLCSIPLAVAGNLVRIIMLTVGVLAVGPEKALGTEADPSFFHMLAGYVVFAVAIVGMLAVNWILLNGHRVVGMAKTFASQSRKPASISSEPKSTKPFQDVY